MTLSAENKALIERVSRDHGPTNGHDAFAYINIGEPRLNDLLNADRDQGREMGDWRPTHRHVKRGTEYRALFDAVLQFTGPWDETPMVVYEDKNGHRWTRPKTEFNDGRFTPLPVAPGVSGEEG